MAYGTSSFLADCENRYEVVHTSSLVHDEAFRLLYRYGKTNSLRALDALQIATLLVYRESDDDRFVCADRRLSEVLTLEDVDVLLVGIP
jgi:predicted nucleic acid-binding protein